MIDWFSPSARYEETFRRTLEGARVVLSLRLDKGGYAKHGTGIAVRVLVIDKVPGEIGASTINRASVSELFAALPSVPLRATLRDPTPAAAPRPKLSLFRSVKTGPARPVIVRAPQTNDVRPVSYEVLAEPAAMGEQRGVYADYRPSRVVIAEAGEHPTHLVESAAMASIAAPKPSYVPSLPERTVTARLLSAAQLETVIYAGEAWSRDLHGRFSHPAGEVALKEDPEGKLYRTGFFLGDGTGAGKGRQAAACILDQWLKGNRRHIWISKNAPLLEDAMDESTEEEIYSTQLRLHDRENFPCPGDHTTRMMLFMNLVTSMLECGGRCTARASRIAARCSMVTARQTTSFGNSRSRILSMVSTLNSLDGL